MEEYTCALCGGVFLKEQSDKEAKKELKENFPGFGVEYCQLVCDDCYKEF